MSSTVSATALRRRARKRVEGTAASPAPAATDPRQMALPLDVAVVRVANLSPGSTSDALVVVIGKAVAQLGLPRVTWELDLRAGHVLPVPLAHALAVGCDALPVAPDAAAVAKALSDMAGPRVEYGFHGDDLHEYFVTKGGDVNGVVHLKRAAKGWKASMQKTLVPYVLTPDAVKKGRMPGKGCSALPKSLERVVPKKFRYWEQGDVSKAEAVRNALVDSGLFNERLIKVVDGDLRLCVEQLFLYEPTEEQLTKAEEAEAPTLRTVLPQLVPAEMLELQLVSPLAEDGWREKLVAPDADTLLVLSAPTDDVLQAVVVELAKGATTSPWIAEYTDTPEARGALGALGRLFKVRVPDAEDRVFVASFAFAEDMRVEYVDTAKALEPEAQAVSKPFAGFEDFGACVAAQKKAGHSDESAHRICGALQAETEKQMEALNKRAVHIAKAGEDEDQRFVLGIVLEPDVVDAQNDTYSADEVRKTAHDFMEKYRTIGLMHKGAVNDKVKILESYIAPCDFAVDGAPVKAGTWMLAVRVQDDDLWKACKKGELTGFSIGGSAIRRPDAGASAPAG